MDVTLKARPRTESGSGAARRLRATGEVPAVLYGAGIEGGVPVAVNRRELVAALSTGAALNALITLEVEGDGDAHLTMARELQRDPVRHELLHVDFLAIRRDQDVTVDVPVHLVGEAPATRNDFVVTQHVNTITVSCLPGNVPNSFEVDQSGLETAADAIRAGDVVLPAGVTLVTDPDELVAAVVGVAEELPEVAEAAAEGEEAAAAAPEAPEASAEQAARPGDAEAQ